MAKKEKLDLKCDVCGTKYEKTKEMVEVIEGTGYFEENEVYKCPKCGDIIMTSEQLRTLRNKAGHFRLKRKLGISGNALVLRIPADLKEFYHLSKEDVVEIIPIDKKKFLVEVE